MTTATRRVTCKFDDCEDRATARELCNRHYSHWYRHGDPASPPPSSRVPVAPPASDQWRDTAACRPGAKDIEPDLFFPVGVTGPANQQNVDAKQVCRRCPVRVDCLAYAVGTGQEFGVFGGLTPDERRDLSNTARRALNKAATR